MEVFEITGFKTGVSQEGVNFLQPSDSFQNIENGFIHRQLLQSRRGFNRFGANGLAAGVAPIGDVADGTRVMGIFQHTKKNNTFQTLAISQKFLYAYNEGTNTWDQIINAGSAPVNGFSISQSEDYVSGTSYPDYLGNDRFIFCGNGLSDIYFYDGTDVRSFTTVADNAKYQAPASGALSKALFCNRFGERLNFYNPTIGGAVNPQAVLYSGIRDSSGKGDQYNVVGAGLLAADTSDFINGVLILGNSVVITFNNSTWTLEKTSDAFNPYFIKQVPSVIGTDAPFSAVAWGRELRSIGKGGIIATDLRSSTRVDTKIPYFTRDVVSPDDFEMTFGGFNRQNSQFMWSYKSTEGPSLDLFQDKVLVNNYEEESWSIYDMEFSVFAQSNNGENLRWEDIHYDSVTNPEEPSWSSWETTEEIWNKIGRNATVEKTLAGDNKGFIYNLDQDNDDRTVAITTPAITQAAQAVVTTATQGFSVGDEVTISGVTGMTEINSVIPADPDAEYNPYIIQAITSTTMTLNVNSTDFTAADVDTGFVSQDIAFSAELIPFNPFRSQGRKVYVSHIDFLVDTNGGFLDVDIFADEEETPFKRGTRLQTDNIQKRRQWITLAVNNESEFMTLKFSQRNPNLQVKITSIRIYASPGGLTNA